MSRPQKIGIDYFQFPVDFFEKSEIKLLQRRYPNIGVVVYIYMVSRCYKENGYYYDFNDNDKLELLAFDFNIKDIETLRELFFEFGRLGLFDSDTLTSKGILTSPEIQNHYCFATKVRRKKGTKIRIRHDILLIELSEVDSKVEVIDSNSSKIPSTVKTDGSETDYSPITSEFFPGKTIVLPENNPHSIEKNKIEKNSIYDTFNSTNSDTEIENQSNISVEDTHTHPLNCFIKNKYGSILDIKYQMTYEECETLKKIFDNDTIKKAIEQLDNKPKDKYLKVFTTLKTFCSTIKPCSIEAKADYEETASPIKYVPISVEEAQLREKERRRKEQEESPENHIVEKGAIKELLNSNDWDDSTQKFLKNHKKDYS